MTKLFLHGVPNTPALWEPLIAELGLAGSDYIAPALPGFGAPIPNGFTHTKEAYLGWLIDHLQEEYDRDGPVDIVGHDWGALLCMRAAHLRPELVHSWTVLNAVLVSGYKWHSTARVWQTPVLGEISMAISRTKALEAFLNQAGMSADLAGREAMCIDRIMKRSILKLYRSAKNPSNDWVNDVSGLPIEGLVIWGDQDPFIKIEHARRFCETESFPLHIEQGAGHWAVCERPRQIANRLLEHWNRLEED